MARHLFIAAACCMALSVAAGAFGAHALRQTLPSTGMDLWKTACSYLTIAASGALIAALAAAVRPAGGWVAAGLALLAGGVVFSGTVGALALGAPRWIGAVTPLGGLLIIFGYLAMAATAARWLGPFDTTREPV